MDRDSTRIQEVSVLTAQMHNEVKPVPKKVLRMEKENENLCESTTNLKSNQSMKEILSMSHRDGEQQQIACLSVWSQKEKSDQ